MADEQVYRSFAELGQEYIRQYPELQGLDAAEIGRQAAPQLADHGIRVVEGFTDIDPLETVANFPGDFLTSTGEALEGIGQAALSPIDTSRNVFNLATGALSETARGQRERPGAQRSLLTQLLGRGVDATGMADEESRQMFRDFSQDTAQALEPAGVQQRPANALMALLGLAPVGPGQMAQAGRLGKTLSFVNPGMAAERVATAPIAAAKLGAKGVSRAKSAVQGSAQGGLLSRLARPVAQTKQDLVTGGRPLGQEAVATGLAITTGRPRQFITQLIQRGKDADFRRFFRQARKLDEGELAGRIQQTALGAMNKLQTKMSTMYQAGTDTWFGGGGRGPLVDTKPLHATVVRHLGDIGVTASKGRRTRLNFRRSDVTDLGPARAVINSQVGPLVRILNRLDEVPLKELHRRRKLLDDAISTLTPDNPTARTARKALVSVRESVADYLEASLPKRYAADMAEYRRLSVVRDELKENLRLEPGQIDKAGQVAGGTQEGALRAMEQGLGDSGVGSRRLRAMEALEREAGVTGIVDLNLAQMAQAWAGGGLIVRNELAQIGRGVAAVVTVGGAGALGGVLAALPATVLFSPRMMSEAILLSTGKGRQVKNFSATQLASLRTRMSKVAGTMNQMDAMTGGELRTTALREGWNIAQMLERFEIQEERE